MVEFRVVVGCSLAEKNTRVGTNGTFKALCQSSHCVNFNCPETNYFR